ncbi:MAG TPA: pyridoxamine 5'-phosphate oxidase family protein [Dongiaceae bacterium]|nr:pyridoxamine 5'-phosphate oxidase family protein [Dongiaceae bacterium]
MRIDELDQTTCREILSRASFGRLACSLNDQPYVIPVGFAYEAEQIYVFATLGQKIKWMRSNPKVCLQVDEITGKSDWVSVIANGEYQELPEPQFEDERNHARKLLQQRHHWWLNAVAERRIQMSDHEIKPLFFRIRATSVTGLRATSEGD